MKIIICDDEPKDQKKLQQVIQKYFYNRNMDCEIKTYFDAAAIDLNIISKCDILFMDIFMPNSNGMDIIKMIRQNISCPIIFISSSRDFAIEAFNVNAIHYLIKPFIEEKIYEALDRCMSSISKAATSSEDIIEIKLNGSRTPISTKDIIYVEVFNNLSIIHTTHSDIQTYSTLTALYEQMDDTLFMRPHRSYIVNMKYILKYCFDHILLENGQEIMLSRKKRTELKQQYQNFLFREARKGTL